LHARRNATENDRLGDNGVQTLARRNANVNERLGAVFTTRPVIVLSGKYDLARMVCDPPKQGVGLKNRLGSQHG
jgi:hypothetical protein